MKLKKNRFRTELRQHFFSERVIDIWNKLDKDTADLCGDWFGVSIFNNVLVILNETDSVVFAKAN